MDKGLGGLRRILEARPIPINQHLLLYLHLLLSRFIRGDVRPHEIHHRRMVEPFCPKIVPVRLLGPLVRRDKRGFGPVVPGDYFDEFEGIGRGGGEGENLLPARRPECVGVEKVVLGPACGGGKMGVDWPASAAETRAGFGV